MRLLRLSSLLGILLTLAALLVALPHLHAGEHDDRRHDEVRRAVEAGDIKSLADILNTVRDQLPGEVAGVEVERKNGIWLYEFRVVDKNGRLFEVYVDARSGAIVRKKEK